MASWQAPSVPRTQTSITSANPTSLPPIVIVTSVVPADRPPSWLRITSAVVAPAHVSLLNAPPCALCHSTGYALALRRHDPPEELPAPAPAGPQAPSATQL